MRSCFLANDLLDVADWMGWLGRALLDLMQIYCPRREAKSGIKGKYVPSTNFSSIEVVYVDESGVPGYGVSLRDVPTMILLNTETWDGRMWIELRRSRASSSLSDSSLSV